MDQNIPVQSTTQPIVPENQTLQQVVQPDQTVTPVVQNLTPQPQFPQQSMPVNKPSGAALRLSAAIIDNTLILGLLSIICLITVFILNIHILVKDANNSPLVAVYGLLGGVMSIIYYSYFHFRNGATPGKKLFGLRVGEINTSSKLTYSKALLREIVKFGIPVIPLMGGILNIINDLIIVFSKTKQGLHDRVVKSQVIEVEKAISLWKQVLLFLLLIIFWVVPTIILIFFVFNIGAK